MNLNISALIFIHNVTLSHQVKGKKKVGLKALMGTLRKEAIVRVTCWELKFHLFKALLLPTSTYDTEFWGGDLESS